MYLNSANFYFMLMLILTSSLNSSNYTSEDLVQAIFSNDIAKVKEVLDSSKELVNIFRKNRSPLIYAITEKNPEIVKLLIDNEANVNEKDGITGGYPIHFGVLNKKLEIVKLLLNRGANINAQDSEGRTALHLALLRYYDDKENIANFIISQMPKFDIKDNDGYTAFDYYHKIKDNIESKKLKNNNSFN